MADIPKARQTTRGKTIAGRIIKVLNIIVSLGIFAGASLFASGSGVNLAAALLIGLGAVLAGQFLMMLLAPFFSSPIAFLWFIVSLASFFLLLVIMFSQWNQVLAWNKQPIGFYLAAAVAGLTVLYVLFYASIILRAEISYFLKKLGRIINVKKGIK